MRKIFIFVIFSSIVLYSETLFEVKDASNNKVLDVSTDGMAVMNLGDTLMVISTKEIKAVIDDSKALSRKFSVSTTSAKKGLYTDLFDVSLGSATMRESGGNRYTDFSPENIFIGLNSGINTIPLNETSGKNNVFVGNLSGFTNTTGASNVFVGYKSGYSNLSGYNNCFMGQESGYSNYSGRMNVFIGNKAGYNNYDGNYNVFIGYNCGVQNTSGSRNIFIGYESGILNSTGWGNTFVGEASGTANTSGYGNSSFGNNAGFANTEGDYNTSVGYSAGGSITTGNYNSSFGAESGRSNQTGSGNSVFGFEAGRGTPGNSFNNNSFFGYRSGYSNTTGSNNSYLGYQSGYTNAIGTGNVFLGYQAGYGETGSNKLYIDNSSTASPLIYGDFDSDYVKVNGDFDVLNLATVGGLDVNGDADISGTLGTGTTTMDGTFMRILTDPGTGATPTNYVYQGGMVNSTSKAYAFSIYDALWVTSNTFIDGTITAPLVYSTAVGTTYSDLYIDNTGKIGYLASSERYKNNIRNMEDVSWLYRLRPVNYSYKTDETNKKEYGLIAEEVEKINPAFVKFNPDGSAETVNYSSLISPMLKALQDHQKMIDDLKKEIEILKAK